jgi:uncharacterized membrane protein
MSVNTNVSDNERWISAMGGAMLAAYGISRQSFPGTILAAAGGALMVRGAVGFCPAYASLDMNSARSTKSALGGSRGISVDVPVTIARQPSELYECWRQLDNLPKFMTHLVSVTPIDTKRSHWVAKAPAGRTVEWDAEILTDKPNELIGWRTLDGADVISAGSVRFKPTGKERETEVHVHMQYEPLGGKVGAAIAWLLGDEPSQVIREDLRRFKSLMEAGEVPTTEGQPRGKQSILNYT